MKTANICRPPGDTRYRHIQSSFHLNAQHLKSGANITGPYKCAIPLTSRPRTANQVDNVGLPFCLHTLIEGTAVFSRVHIAYLHARSQMITVDVMIIDAKFRLRFIEPKDFNPFVIIILFYFAPKEFSRLRIGRVKYGIGTDEVKLGANPRSD